MQMQLPMLPITVLLVFIRFTALTSMTVIFGRNVVPIRIRVAIAMALSWVVLSNIPPEWVGYCEKINQVVPLVIALAGEVMLGLAIGLVIDLFFAILGMTSTLFARASSLMMAKMLDPTSGEQSVSISTLFSILFTVLIFLWGGHLFLIKLVVESFSVLPPGFFWFRHELLDMYVQLSSDVFSWGLRFALPAMAGGMLVSVAMGLISKMSPEFNVMVLGLPFRLFMGLGILSLFMICGYDPLFKVFEAMMLHIKYLWVGGL